MTILIVLAAAGLAAAMSTVKVHIEYHRRQQDDRFFVNIAVIKGLLSFKTEFTGVDLEKKLSGFSVKIDSEVEAELVGAGTGVDMGEKVPLTLRNISRWLEVAKAVLDHLKYYKETALWLARSTRVRELDWTTGFGLGDAAATGVVTGVIWSIKSVALQGFYRLVQGSLLRTKVKVLPDFAGKSVNIDIRCIFDIKTGHIIIAGCRILIIRLKLLILRTLKGV